MGLLHPDLQRGLQHWVERLSGKVKSRPQYQAALVSLSQRGVTSVYWYLFARYVAIRAALPRYQPSSCAFIYSLVILYRPGALDPLQIFGPFGKIPPLQVLALLQASNARGIDKLSHFALRSPLGDRVNVFGRA